jgi:hypothetical protein
MKFGIPPCYAPLSHKILHVSIKALDLLAYIPRQSRGEDDNDSFLCESHKTTDFWWMKVGGWDSQVMDVKCECEHKVVVYRVAMAFVISLFRASSFFLSSSGGESSISS